jgi:hypothetical protein
VATPRRLVGDLPRLLDQLRPVCFFDTGCPDSYRNRRALRAFLTAHVTTLDVPHDEPEY